MLVVSDCLYQWNVIMLFQERITRSGSNYVSSRNAGCGRRGKMEMTHTSTFWAGKRHGYGCSRLRMTASVLCFHQIWRITKHNAREDFNLQCIEVLRVWSLSGKSKARPTLFLVAQAPLHAGILIDSARDCSFRPTRATKQLSASYSSPVTLSRFT